MPHSIIDTVITIMGCNSSRWRKASHIIIPVMPAIAVACALIFHFRVTAVAMATARPAPRKKRLTHQGA